MTSALITTCVCAGTAALWAVVSDSAVEVIAGMVAPLAAAVATWLAAEHAYRVDPRAVMRVLLMAWAAKVLFFGSYVVMMLEGLGLRPTPFVISFTVYFIALHAVDAALLRRLFWGRPATRGAH